MPTFQKIRSDWESVPKFFRKYVKRFFNFLKEKLGKYIQSIILYGSVARDTWGSESDIDLLLILKDTYFENHNKETISSLVIEFYNEIRKEYSIIVEGR